MQARTSTQRWAGLTAVGVILILVGVGAFVLRELRLDPFAAIAEGGWPFFVIVPGVTLLIASLIPKPPNGVGFAVAGAIVTVVGSLLLYQETTGHWESWAYAWILVGPGAAGLGMLVYGLIFRQRELLATGARMVVIAGAIFAVGFWFFETIFETGRVPFEMGAWWPVGLMAIGLVVVVSGLLDRGQRTQQSVGDPLEQGGVR